MRKIWNIRQKDKKKAAGLAAEVGVSTLLAGILLNRISDFCFMLMRLEEDR